MKYDVDYFIRKFEAIPEEKWCTGDLYEKGRSCALGHCGVRDENIDEYENIIGNKEGLALGILLRRVTKKYRQPYEVVYNLNDNGFWFADGTEYKQPTPKQRILAALYDIKKLQDDKTKTEPKERIKTVYVSVPESIVNQSKELILQ